ncbi:MAG: hypothetical protein R3C05_11850 [Pirellulaceae bacterium]
MKKLIPSSKPDQMPRRLFVGGFVGLTAFAPMVGSAIDNTTDKGDVESTSARRPVPPYRVWFQPGLFHRDIDLYEQMTIDASGWLDPRLAEAAGKTTLDWVYGLQHPWAKSSDYWRNACSTTERTKGKHFVSAGIAVDEWVPPILKDNPSWLADGLRAGRKANPEIFISVWVTDPTPPLFALVHEETVDLVIVEGYTHVAPSEPATLTTSWEGGLRRCDAMKEAGLIDKTIFCFGHITAGAQRNGQRLTSTWLRERAEELKERYPEMPGVAFFQRGDNDSPEFRDLIRFCDRLSGELWPGNNTAPQRNR